MYNLLALEGVDSTDFSFNHSLLDGTLTLAAGSATVTAIQGRSYIVSVIINE